MENLLKPKEVAKRLGICNRKVQNMCDSGLLKSNRTKEGRGGRRFIPESEIINILNKQSTRICELCNKELSIDEFYDTSYKRMFHNCKKCNTKIIQIKYINKVIKKYGTPIKNCESCKDDKNCNICSTEYKILNGICVGKNQLRIYLNIIKNCRCDRCKNTDWMGEPIPLDVHHIDGNKKNINLNNLQLLCKNCHAQTDNYCFKNSLISKNKKHLNTIKYN